MKNLIRAYRVEHIEGQGPYRPPPHWTQRTMVCGSWRKNWAKHIILPAPCLRDLVSDPKGKERCACKDLKQLRKWFEGFWGDLRELGYMLVEIEGRPLWQGETWSQCILSDIVVIKDLSDTMDEFAKAKS